MIRQQPQIELTAFSVISLLATHDRRQPQIELTIFSVISLLATHDRRQPRIERYTRNYSLLCTQFDTSFLLKAVG